MMKSPDSPTGENHNHIESLEHAPHLYAESRESALHPDRNEDAFFLRHTERALGVFDGMGGGERGEVASHLSALYIEQEIQRVPMDALPEVVEARLRAILIEASEILSIAWRKRRQAIRRLSRALNTSDDGVILSEIIQFARDKAKKAHEDPAQVNLIAPTPFGFATTALVAKEAREGDGKRYMIVAAVGDSRLYVLRTDGSLEACTLDNAIGDRLIYEEDWELQKRLATIAQATDFRSRDERTAFEERNIITQGLGVGFSEKNPTGPTSFLQVAPFMASVEIKEGDMFFATSDGIHDNLTDKEIAEIMRAHRSGNSAHALIEAAYDRSLDSTHIRQKPDDTTVVVYDTIHQGPNTTHPDTAASPTESVLDGIRFARSEKELLQAIEGSSLLPGNYPHEWHAANMIHARVEAFFHGTGTLDDIPNQLIRNKAESLMFVRNEKGAT